MYHTIRIHVQMLESFRGDLLVAFLLENSSLTPAQLDTILASQNDGTLDSKRSLREKRKVSSGAFVRTLRQAQRNIEASIYSLMLLSYLGIIPEEKINQFLRTERLVLKVKEMNPDQENMQQIIEGMQEFAGDFSGRKRGRKVIL